MAIGDEISALGDALDAAAPVRSAPRRTLYALRGQVDAIIASIDATIASRGGVIDGTAPAPFGQTNVQAMQAAATAAAEQATLAMQRGYVGRIAANLRGGPQ